MLADLDPANAEPETDRGPRDGRAGPVRTCIATRRQGARDAMLRFVAGPDGTVVPDLAARLPGRGAWVGLGRTAVETAVKRRAFARAFRREVTVDPALADQVDRLLERSALEALSLANKAGAVVAGFAKVEAAIAAGDVAALIHAREAADDGVSRLDRALRASLSGYGPGNAPDGGELPILRLFTVEQLSLSLGRSNVIHAAVLAGAAGSGFLARTTRLGHYRSDDPAEAGLQQPCVRY
ncbi:RNA-binding protein [Blastochloris tepida]|uniref:DNA-binding protein n=1 Tax=Blastochloris tepida TaxID=2233851 RepID=A0A348G3Z3_9HYPH|nr:RNA-binding protein [Blastochloris tepida]BBF94276.1 DNA-binding protein [Blastochloris tepida]